MTEQTEIMTEPTSSTEPVEIHRNGRLAAVTGGLAAVLAVAFLVRGSGALDLALGIVLAALAGYQLFTAWDARTPVLLADAHGVRIRLGGSWTGLRWNEIDEVEHLPRRSWWRDGRLVVLPVEEDRHVAALGSAGRRQAAVARRLYGAPFALPLGLGTAVTGGSGQLSIRLADLAGDAATIVEIDPALADESDVEGAASVVEPPWAEQPEPLGEGVVETPDPAADPMTDTAERPVFASPTPSPLRQPIAAVRAEVTRDLTRDYTIGANALKLDTADTEDGTASRLPEADQLRPAREVDWAGITPIARPGEAVEPIVIDELGATPAVEPVIGPELAAARTRLGLGIDQLAERTRIRPHVLESIEVDDFGPCGGDFYARGHLRTLGRVLGVDAAPLLRTYDATYADAPINPRRVFEAELATGAGGPIRRMKGGPNWSVLVAAVMAVVLAWSIARLVFDGSATTPPPAPSLGSGSQGTTNPSGNLPAPVPVSITAAGGGAHVVVRDGGGTIVYTGDLAFGETKLLTASPPVRVQSSDGSATVAVDGGQGVPLGATGEQAQRTFTVD